MPGARAEDPYADLRSNINFVLKTCGRKCSIHEAFQSLFQHRGLFVFLFFLNFPQNRHFKCHLTLHYSKSLPDTVIIDSGLGTYLRWIYKRQKVSHLPKAPSVL